MKVCDKIGVNPVAWKGKKFEDFESLCKGVISPKDIKKEWERLQKLKPNSKKQTTKEGGE